MHFWLQQHFYYFIVFLFIIGLIIGSFLNVVIYRLPIMLKRQWQQQCHEFLQLNNETNHSLFNLAWPNSHCTYCKKPIKPHHNIPLLSYIFLRGRCAYCDAIISWQYPAIELLTAALSVIVAFHFGVTLQCLCFLLLTYALICLALIDLNHQILPDTVTLSFLWLGLFLNIFNVFTTLPNAVLGALIGYISLWLFNYIFKFFMKKEGMGYGDFKLFALFGAWFGWEHLPFILIGAAGAGAIIGLILIALKKISRTQPISFGPFLAIAGWIVGLFFVSLNS